jgi:hypothetical protein
LSAQLKVPPLEKRGVATKRIQGELGFRKSFLRKLAIEEMFGLAI